MKFYFRSYRDTYIVKLLINCEGAVKHIFLANFKEEFFNIIVNHNYVIICYKYITCIYTT